MKINDTKTLIIPEAGKDDTLIDNMVTMRKLRDKAISLNEQMSNIKRKVKMLSTTIFYEVENFCDKACPELDYCDKNHLHMQYDDGEEFGIAIEPDKEEDSETPFFIKCLLDMIPD